MSYELSSNGVTVEAVVRRLEDETFEVVIDGKPTVVAGQASGDGLLHLMIEGHSYEVAVSSDNGTWTIGVYDDVFRVKVRDERERMFDALSGGVSASGPSVVHSPMPGRVVAYQVEEGDLVEEGSPVAVVEAMKMENVLKAGRSGVVIRLGPEVGASVEAGTLLVEIADDERDQ